MSPVATTTIPSQFRLSEPSLLFSSLDPNVANSDELESDRRDCESVYSSEDDGHEERGPTLTFILEVPVIHNVKGMLEYLFPDSGIGSNPKKLLEQLSLKANGGWRDVPDLRHWNKGSAMAAKYIDLLANFSRKILSSKTQNGIVSEPNPAWVSDEILRTWASVGQQGIRPIERGALNCEPSLVLLDGPWSSEGDQLDWTRVLATLIYKPSDVFKLDAERECIEYAECMFLAQPFRRFVVTIYLIDTTMAVMYFDRSGCLVSQEFDVHKEPESFLRIILGMLLVERTGIGLDLTASTEASAAEDVLCFVEVEGRRFELNRHLHSIKGLEGKGTFCFSGKDDDGNIVVIKDCWVDQNSSGNEVGVLKLLNNSQAGTTPEDVRRHEESLCTPDGVRVIPKFIAGQNVQVETTVSNDGASRIVKRPSTTGTIREALGLLRAAGNDPTRYVWVNSAFAGIAIRYHWRIVTSPKGAIFDTSTAPTIRDLKLIAHDIIYAIKALRDKNIVHRDICDMNIVVQRHKGMARGLLIDFDSATNIERVMNEAISERKGTLEFMTLDRLVPNITAPHTYFHDLQSLLLVLCWFCSPLGIRRKEAFSSRALESVRARWSGFDYSTRTMDYVRKAKTEDLLSDEAFEKNVLKNFRSRYEMMKEPLRNFRRLLFGPWDVRAVARALLMPVIVREPRAHLSDVSRYANLLHPSERSPTLVFLSMAEHLHPRELPGVSYDEGTYDSMVSKAVHEQYLQLFAVPTPIVMAYSIEVMRRERRSKVKISKDRGKRSDEGNGDGEGGDDGNYAEDFDLTLEKIEKRSKKNSLLSAKARVVEVFLDLREDHPWLFVGPAGPSDVLERMRKGIRESEGASESASSASR